MTISLRPAQNNDYSFLFDLHEQAMRPYIDATWGCVDEWQAEYFRKKFDPNLRQIIQVDGQDAGVLVVEDHDDRLYLALIELLPAYQGHGIGSALIRDIQQRAKQTQRPLTLHVLKTNPRAIQLYQRLGFAIIQEEDVRWLMEFAP